MIQAKHFYFVVQDVEKSFHSWDSLDSESIHPGECIQQLLDHVRRHKVNIDGNVCTVIVTTLVLEVLFACYLSQPSLPKEVIEFLLLIFWV